MGGSDDETLIGQGKGPDGAAVKFYEVFRPETMGAKGSTGIIYEVRGGDDKRITHSDSMKGLESAGYTLTVVPAVVPAQEEKSVEDELAGV